MPGLAWREPVAELARKSEEALRAYYSNRLVAITGGSSGIGFALAQRAVALGARVVLIADGRERLEAAVLELGGSSRGVSSIVCDVGHRDAVRSAVASLRHEHGVPDILINNAGFAVYRTFEQSNFDEIDELVRVNFAGHMLFTKEVLDGMIERGSGHIVNIASVAGLFTLTPNAVYGASKSGMVAWTRALRVELSRYGIGVSVVCPGRVETAFFDHDSFRQRKSRRETRLTIGLPTVVETVLDAARRNREIVVVPRYWGWFARGLALVPYGLRAHHALLRRRVDDLYN